MRSRLLTFAAALALVAVVLFAPAASPASAHCGGHGTHPDLYSAGGISFKNGSRIHRYPHLECTVDGLGYPSHGIDVHCAVITGSIWYYVRNTTTGVVGWVRHDALDYAHLVVVQVC